MTLARICALVALVLSFASMHADIAVAVPLTVSVDQREGLPSLSLGGGSAMTSQFVFWTGNWNWAGLDTQFKIVAPFEYAISGIDKNLGFNLSGSISKRSEQQLRWVLDFDAAETKTAVIGGGIAFKFDLADFALELGEPSLLPDGRGWTWGRSDSAQVTMRFDPPLPSLYFERGQKSEIRALFYSGTVPRGHGHFVATLTLSGDSTIAPTLAERFGISDSASWPTNILNWSKSPVDLSFLNSAEKPAGKHGFVKALGDHLVFADGKRARFWGTNVAAYSLFATKSRQAIKNQAKRLSELGFNLVRIVHIDSDWVQPNIFGMRDTDTQRLDSTSLDQLDWWIKCLENEGIYIWLDLNDGRRLTAADKIDDFTEISKGRPTTDLRGFNYVNPSIQKAMERFNEALLTHVNRYTGLPYKDDPGIIGMIITNENDVTNHFGNALLPDKRVPHEDALYMAQAASFAAKNNLSKDQTWRSWLPGPSKLFLNDLEHNFNTNMIGQLRRLGVRALLATTDTWGGNPLSSLPALTDSNIIDVHSYGSVGTLETNPIYAANLVDWIAAARILDRPLSVTEWNVASFSIPDRDVVPLYVAGTADLQGWDALMHYAYSQEALDGPGKVGDWEAYNDPSLLATMPAAALLYRRQDADKARTTFIFAPTEQQLFNKVISPDNSVALRTAAERGRVMVAMPSVHELPWLKPSDIPPNAEVITDPNRALLAPTATQAVSDTGQITRNWQQGTYTINTPRTQAAAGWIGGKDIRLTDVKFDITTPNATVAVQSLDNEPINTANALLISLGAQSAPSADRRTFRSEPVTGRLTIKAKKGMKFYRRDGDVQLETNVQSSYVDGHYYITLRPQLATYWLVMK